MKDDLISRQAAIDAVCAVCGNDCDKSEFVYNAPQDEQVILCPEHYVLCTLPSAQFEPQTIKGFPIDADLLMQKVEEKYGFRARDRLYELIRNMPKYEFPHEQPEILHCKDCDWWTKQEDSLQGRCELMQMYPTGSWFCANAKRREDG